MDREKTTGYVLITLISLILLIAVINLPAFGSFQNKDVVLFYLRHGLVLTGSANIVNSIVWDFRGYDTMGEETVLFTATMGVFLIIRRKKYGHNR